MMHTMREEFAHQCSTNSGGINFKPRIFFLFTQSSIHFHYNQYLTQMVEKFRYKFHYIRLSTYEAKGFLNS